MENKETLRNQIALTLLPNVGPVLARNLVSYCGGIDAVFKQKQSHLQKIPEIGPATAAKIAKQVVFARADQEMEFIEKHKVQALFYLDPDFPQRLKHCHDSPVMLYYKGNTNLNKQKVIAIVGTRSATEYGKNVTEKLIEQLTAFDVLIVSGLAYGIDIFAHRAALKEGLSTIGVMGHGLDRLYPGDHRNTAKKMLEQGGLLTEFPSQTNPDRENFPKRNRVVAGMCDAVVVIEAGAKGGALITADIAHSYSRDVFAVPGRLDDPFSVGCNKLIRINKAALLTSANDIAYLMGWEKEGEISSAKKIVQQQLFIELTSEEQILVDVLKLHGKLSIDALTINAKIPFSKLSVLLLQLEMKNVVKSLPGKVFTLV